MSNSFREWLRQGESKELNEMAPTYLPGDTGLKEIIWVSPKNANHGPRIKVYNLNKSKDFSVTIEDEPKLIAGKCFVSSREFAKIIEFIKLNKENLLKYWNYGLSTQELAHNMLKVSD